MQLIYLQNFLNKVMLIWTGSILAKKINSKDSKSSAKNIKKSKVKKENKPPKTKKINNNTSKKSKETSKSSESKTKKNEEIKEKPRSNKKLFLLLITIIIIVGLIGIVWFATMPEVAKAQLIIESGSVKVKHEGGSWFSAQNGTLLYQSDYVKTGDNASASIILFKGSIIRIDKNTEIKIELILQQADEISVKIEQDVGRTWHTVSKISGIDNYEVQTPTTVASVRGTSFGVNVTELGNTTVSVGSGNVNVSKIENGTVVETVEVHENQSVNVGSHKGQPLETKSTETDDWIEENQEKDEKFRGDIKQELSARIEPYIPELKETYGVTDQELEVLLDSYIKGYWDLPPDTPEWIKELFDLSS